MVVGIFCTNCGCANHVYDTSPQWEQIKEVGFGIIRKGDCLYPQHCFCHDGLGGSVELRVKKETL